MSRLGNILSDIVARVKSVTSISYSGTVTNKASGEYWDVTMSPSSSIPDGYVPVGIAGFESGASTMYICSVGITGNNVRVYGRTTATIQSATVKATVMFAKLGGVLLKRSVLNAFRHFFIREGVAA